MQLFHCQLYDTEVRYVDTFSQTKKKNLEKFHAYSFETEIQACIQC